MIVDRNVKSDTHSKPPRTKLGKASLDESFQSLLYFQCPSPVPQLMNLLLPQAEHSFQSHESCKFQNAPK